MGVILPVDISLPPPGNNVHETSLTSLTLSPGAFYEQTNTKDYQN